MPNNDMCDSECNAPECFYDFGDCFCAYACSPSFYGMCKGNCVTAACDFDGFERVEGCTNHFLITLNLYNAIATGNPSHAYDHSGCLKVASCQLADLQYAYENQQCVSACNRAECLWSMGHCSAVKPSHCSVSFDADVGHCFKCADGFVQYLGKCFETCPRGFETLEAMPQLCRPRIQDETETDEIYVFEDSSNSSGDGSYSSPYPYLALAVAAAWQTRTVIYLLGSSASFTTAFVHTELLFHANVKDLLPDSRCQKLTIKSLTCDQTSHEKCSPDPCTVTWNEGFVLTSKAKKLSIINVFFTSACTLDQACSPLATTDLFAVIGQSSVLLIQSVKFSHIRANSIILIKSGTVNLVNVSFDNVAFNQDRGAIYAHTYCPIWSTCGSLTYTGGTVSRINNFSDLVNAKGMFLDMLLFKSTVIEGVTFMYNLSKLVSITNFETLRLANCRFENNGSKNYLIAISGSLLLTSEVVMKNSTSAYQLTHITFRNLHFINNFAVNSMISIIMASELLNIDIRGCEFVENQAYQQILLITLYTSIPSYRINGGNWTGYNSYYEPVVFYIPKSWYNITDCIFTRHTAFKEIINSSPNVNLYLRNVQFIGNVIDGNTNMKKAIDRYFSLPEREGENEGTIENDPACSYLAKFLNAINSEFDSIVQVNNTVPCSSAVQIAFGSGNSTLHSFFSSNNTSGTNGAALSLAVAIQLTLGNCTFEGNSAGGKGTVYIEGNADGGVRFKDSVFKGNSAKGGAGIHSEIIGLMKVESTLFQDNISNNERGGALSLIAKLINIFDTSFTGNKAAKGAAIHISSPPNGGLVQVMMNASSFATNFAEDAGASVVVDEGVNLNSSSTITHCQFTGESSLGASVALYHDSGKLTISNSRFAQNSGQIASGLYIQTKEPAVTLLQEVVFDSNERAPAISKPNDFIHSQVSTEHCTFTKNSAASVKMEGGKWTDVESVLVSNRETAVALSVGATVVLTRTSFLDNSTPTSPGSIYILSSATLTCTGCVFEGNYAVGNGGAVSTDQNAVLTMSGCRFQRNRAGLAGGAVYIQSSTKITIEDSQFVENEAGTAGTISLVSAGLTLRAVVLDRNKANSAAGISVVQSSLVVKDSVIRNQETNFLIVSTTSTALIQHSLFENGKGLVGCIDISESTVTVENSIFRNVTVTESAAFQINGSSRMRLENCSVSGVSGEASSVVIAAHSTVSLSIVESVFSEYQLGAVLAEKVVSLVVVGSQFDSALRNQEKNDSPFLSLSASSALIQRSLFENSKGRVSCMNIVDSNATVEDSTFRNVTVAVLSAFQINGNSRVLVDNCSVSEVSGDTSGNVIAARDSVSLSIMESVFSEYQLGAVLAENVEFLVIAGSKFVSGTGGKGSAICCYDCEDAKITDSVFVEQVSTSGAVYFEWTLFTQVVGNLTISNTRWEHNTSGGDAGGLMVLNYQMVMVGCSFTDNSAPTANSVGGALYSTCGSIYTCNYTIQDTSFVNNVAAKAGGGIYWQDKQPLLLGTSNEGNSAQYGPDVASFPVSVNFTVLDESSSNREVESAIHAAPGQRVKAVVTASLIDHYGQLVNIDSASVGQLISTTTGSTISSDKKTAFKGQFVFDDFLIYAEQDSFVNLSVSSESWDLGTVELLFYMRACVPGESTTSDSCFICPESTYSFNTSLTCQQCLAHTQCLGNYTMLPDPGYWRPEVYSVLVFECPLKGACRGGGPMDDGSISYEGFCAQGYKSNMCQSCGIGYSYISSNKCGKCPRQELNIIRIVFVAIGIFLVNAVLLLTSLKSALKPESLHSIYFKIMANYWQLVFLVTEFRLKWPDPILELFSAQQSVGGAAEQVYSIDCWLADNGDPSSIFYQKMVYIAILPALVIAIAVLYWVAAAIIKSKRVYLKRELLATVIIAFFIIHTTLMETLFSLFSCVRIKDNEYWLTTDMAIKCDTYDHVFNKLAVGVPAIIVWVVGFPLICLGVLIKYRRRHTEDWLRLQYGFLLSGYRPSRYYWEFVLLARKLAVTCCFVFITTSIQVKALTLQLVLIVIFYLQNEVKPFAGAGLNRLELMAITTAGLTIFCGLYYLSEDLTPGGKWFFFLVIIFVNIVFVVQWGIATLKELVVVGIKALPHIGSRLFPSLFERDEYMEDFVASVSKKDYGHFELEDLRSLYLQVRDIRQEPMASLVRNSCTGRQDSVTLLSA